MERAVIIIVVVVLLLGVVAGGLFFTVRSQTAAAARAQQVAMLLEMDAVNAAEKAEAEVAHAKAAVGQRPSSETNALLGVPVTLLRAKAAADGFVPAHPRLVPDLQEWLENYAEPLVAVEPRLRVAIQELERVERSDAEEFRLRTFRKLATDLAAFASESGTKAIVEQRLIWSRSVRQLTDAHPKSKVTWAEARQAVATADEYAAAKIDLTPQLGLVPIGLNPTTGWVEFYHLRSAWDPKVELDPANLRIPKPGAKEAAGIVFALMAGPAGNPPMFVSVARPTEEQLGRLAGGLAAHGLQAGSGEREGFATRRLIQ